MEDKSEERLFSVSLERKRPVVFQESSTNVAEERKNLMKTNIAMSWWRVLYTLNEKVGFKIPTTRHRKNSILCGALQIGTAKWTSGVRWSFRASRVARGIQGS